MFKQLQKDKVKCCGGDNFIERQTPRLSTAFLDNPPTPDLRIKQVLTILI